MKGRPVELAVAVVGGEKREPVAAEFLDRLDDVTSRIGSLLQEVERRLTPIMSPPLVRSDSDGLLQEAWSPPLFKAAQEHLVRIDRICDLAEDILERLEV